MQAFIKHCECQSLEQAVEIVSAIVEIGADGGAPLNGRLIRVQRALLRESE